MNEEFPVATRTAPWHAIGAGSLLLTVGLIQISAVVIGAGSPALSLLLLGGVVMVVVAGVIAALRLLPAQRDLLIVWPVAMCLLMFLAGLTSPNLTEPMPGVITLAFAYIGLCLAPNRSWWLLLPAAAALVVGLDLEARQVLIRVPSAAALWVIIAEVPSRLLDRLRQKNQELRIAACTDSLTGLLDRTTLDEHLERLDPDSCVVVIDLDGFKAYNDTYGHRVGDEILVAFADGLRSAARPADRLFRTGGDEFLILMPTTSVEGAESVLTRFRQRWADTRGRPAFSAGIAPGGTDPMHAADTMMYRHKRRASDRTGIRTPPPAGMVERRGVGRRELDRLPGLPEAR